MIRTNKPVDIGNGFRDHGVAAAISSSKGIVATVDGAGRDIVLILIADHRGGYGVLSIEAETGKSVLTPMPFALKGGCAFASILSSRNKLYTHYDSHFVEYDPVSKAFAFCHVTFPAMAMSMTEDDAGRIWTGTFPDSGVLCFDPATRAFRDYGSVSKQPWKQYPRNIAADSEGWIYFTVGTTATQLFALDPVSGQARPALQEHERKTGMAYLYRAENGKVYGTPGDGNTDGWLEFFRGSWTRLAGNPPSGEKRMVAGCQGLFHKEFPGGRKIVRLDLTARKLVTEKSGGVRCEVKFDYPTDGAGLMGVAKGADGRLFGAAAFPSVCFRYEPKTATWEETPSHGQWNVLATHGTRHYIGVYTHGYLVEWDTSKPWVGDEKAPDANPKTLVECAPAINRPHALLACPDGRTVIMGGSPEYGCTGGGLLFWNRENRTWKLLEHTALLPDQCVMSLQALPGGKILGGMSTRPGSGGQRKAPQAELFVMDVERRAIEWHEAVFPGAQEYTDLCLNDDGLVYGLVDFVPWDSLLLEYPKRFFVYDLARRKVVYEQETEAEFGIVGYQQGPRKFIKTPGGPIYLLFQTCIARVEPGTFTLTRVADAPVPITGGGDFADGRLYFVHGSHLYSAGVPG